MQRDGAAADPLPGSASAAETSAGTDADVSALASSDSWFSQRWYAIRAAAASRASSRSRQGRWQS